MLWNARAHTVVPDTASAASAWLTTVEAGSFRHAFFPKKRKKLMTEVFRLLHGTEKTDNPLIRLPLLTN